MPPLCCGAYAARFSQCRAAATVQRRCCSRRCIACWCGFLSHRHPSEPDNCYYIFTIAVFDLALLSASLYLLDMSPSTPPLVLALTAASAAAVSPPLVLNLENCMYHSRTSSYVGSTVLLLASQILELPLRMEKTKSDSVRSCTCTLTLW